VHYEPGSETAAGVIVRQFDRSLAVIEDTHRADMKHKPEVYICARPACYDSYAFTPSGVAETNGAGTQILMNASQLERRARLRRVFLHELVHAFWHQRRIRCLPRWWSEGLAVSISGGGGAERVSVAEAVAAIRAGQVFQVTDVSSCWTRDDLSREGLTWPMFYRQSGLFVDYLRARQPIAFDHVLQRLREGGELFPALEDAYSATVPTLWEQWRVGQIRP
jgi:hypothetical protein